MTKLPSVTIDGLFLSDLFFTFISCFSGGEDLEGEANTFIKEYGLQEQITVDQLVADFKDRV